MLSAFALPFEFRRQCKTCLKLIRFIHYNAVQFRKLTPCFPDSDIGINVNYEPEKLSTVLTIMLIYTLTYLFASAERGKVSYDCLDKGLGHLFHSC